MAADFVTIANYDALRFRPPYMRNVMASYAYNSNTDMIRLTPNRIRLLESILYLLEEATRRHTYLTTYEIVKSLFLADIKHLNAHGRPVTFDNYVAMENGPVASEAYNMLKPTYDWAGAMGLSGAPWSRRRSPADGQNAYRYDAIRESNTKKLSATDLEVLNEGLTLVKSLKFGGVRDFTHRHKAYCSAWKENSGKVFDMDYSLLLDEADEELLHELVDVSLHA